VGNGEYAKILSFLLAALRLVVSEFSYYPQVNGAPDHFPRSNFGMLDGLIDAQNTSPDFLGDSAYTARLTPKQTFDDKG
jgi:hypothetical protein